MSGGSGTMLRRCTLIACALAVGGCGSRAAAPRGPAGDVEVLQSSAAAMTAYDRGDLPQAEALYRRALARARVTDVSAWVADAAYNLAACEIALGRYEAARRHLQEADYDAARARVDPTDVALLSAKVAYLQGRDADALALAGRVLRGGATVGLAARMQATLLAAQVRCDAHDLAGARAGLAEARALGPAAGTSASIRADAARLEGSILRAEGNTVAAAKRFDEAAELLRGSARYPEMARALSGSAEAYRDAGDAASAADRYYRAARGALAQGDAARAREITAAGAAAAGAAGDDAAAGRFKALLDELNAAGP